MYLSVLHKKMFLNASSVFIWIQVLSHPLAIAEELEVYLNRE